MSFCYIDGARVYYEIEGGGPPVVLVHGAGQDTTSWRYNIPSFAKSRTVVALDLPGHGKSQVPEAPISSTAEYASIVLAVIEYLELERPVLMGHSMGSGVCLTVALERGDKVGGVVAVDGADRVVGVFADEIHAAYLGSPPDLMLEMSMESFRSLCSSATPPKRIEEIAQDLLRIYPPVTAADTQAFNSFDISARSGGIEAPVLLIAGTDDFLVTPEMVKDTASRIKDSRVALLEGVGHFPHTEAPERFNKIVGEFLAEL